jgi:hypothetical protein
LRRGVGPYMEEWSPTLVGVDDVGCHGALRRLREKYARDVDLV